MSEPLYVIWSVEHRAWWGPARWGYTPFLTLAGRYSKAEADSIVDKANRYSETVQEIAYPVEDAAASVPSYQCPRCGWVSYNPHDLEQRYCGHCHQFEEP